VSKTYNVIMITILCILIIVLGSFLIMSPKGMFKSKKLELLLEKTYTPEEFSNIYIDVTSADTYLYHSEDGLVKVEVYATEDDKTSSEIENEDLNIVLKNKKKFCFMCVRKSNKINIYLPQEYANTISIKSTSGDIKVSSFNDMKIKVHATSGDVKTKNLKSANLKLTSGDVSIAKVDSFIADLTSGDIEIDEINNYAKIEVTSGDIDINTFNIFKNSSIKTTSGDITINHIDNVYVNSKVTSGDIDVNNSDRKAPYELKIKTTSGDISVN